MWYTLTGNFGNLLPIPSDLGSKSLFKKYHRSSLDIKDKKFKTKIVPAEDTDFEDDFSDECYFESGSSFSNSYVSDKPTNSDSFLARKTDGFDFEDSDDDEISPTCEDEDDEFLRDQLDMHSMILTKSAYGESGSEELYITADEVLNEIETMMSLQEDYYDEMTPDSGCFSVCNNTSFNRSDSHLSTELPIDVNGSYLTYIKTFAAHKDYNNSSNSDSNIYVALDEKEDKLDSKTTDLKKFNIYELNDLIEQIETNTKVLSDDLIQELANRDELEFEKETKNTFISLLMNIQEKRRMLNSENLSTYQFNSFSSSSSRNSNSTIKKRHRRSMINLDSIHSTHLTTIIPFNNQIRYTVQHLQILNKCKLFNITINILKSNRIILKLSFSVLKAIDDDSYQVPELLTNYILKVVCPT